MTTWLRRLRGAMGMGVTWAVAWAVAGVLIGVTSVLLPALPWNAFFDVFDAPLPTLAIPGFVGGAIFSLVLGVVGRRHRFEELSVPKFAAWGAFGGLMLSLVPALAVALGVLDPTGGKHDLWYETAVIAGPFIILSALSAAGSLMVARARRGERARQPEYLA
jgi:hypothetical protein